MFTRVVKLCRSTARWSDRIRGEAGATAVEYSLLIAFIATAIIGVVGTLGGQLLPGFEAVIAGL
ncbi:Flp family type IVb pilin [Pseudarthrobacter sp. S3]|uniref:Flp family type IVb pilin n=1 Tax=Pseudarthrobacter sp. S3 TaxID=3418419 RepID=UPI003CE702CD